jgi:AraC family transcriptional regulator
MRITAVPLRDEDLVRRGSGNGFTITEAWSAPGPIPLHAHEALSITILLDGDFHERYESRHPSQTCAAGSLLIRPPGEIHGNRLGLRGGRTLSIEMDPRRLGLYGKSLAPLLVLAHRREECFLDLGFSMSQELRQSDLAAGLALESLGLELLARLVRIRESNSASTSPPSWLTRVRNLLHDRFREQPLRVSTLASEAGVHPVYLARAFRKHYGITPGEYIRRLRTEWSRQQILNTLSPLAVIAAESGFADQSHLARAFRRKFGIAPGRMRHRRSHTTPNFRQ